MSSKATHFLFKFMFFSAVTCQVWAGELVHGPLELPDHNNQLGFYQQSDKLAAYLNGEQGQPLDSYANGTDVVAVFYQDLDGDQQREVIVMLHDSNGDHLRAYGLNEMEGWMPLPRVQTQLDRLVPTLSAFTVVNVRKALQQLPPQSYVQQYEQPQLDDANIKALLDGTLGVAPKAIQYFTDKDKPTDKVALAARYQLRYPIHAPQQKGQAEASQVNSDYELVATFERPYWGEKSTASFELAEVGYQNAQGEYHGAVFGYMASSPTQMVIVLQANYQQGKLHGHYMELSPRHGAIEVAGDYQHGQRVGQWTESFADDRYWQGEYQHGQRQGKWLLYSFFTDEPVGEANYQQGQLAGNYEIWQITASEPDASGKVPKRLEQKGQYVQGKQQGEWLNRFGDGTEKLHYQNGLRQGERLLTADNGTVLERENYVDDLLDGEASYYRQDGNLKAVKHFSHGQLSGSELSFNKYGKLYRERHYRAFKDGTGTWVSEQHGLSVNYDDERLLKVEQYQHGEPVGLQLTFDEHSGQLKELHNMQLNDGRTGVEMHGRQIWFKPRAPYGLATVADYQHGQKAGMAYHFADDKHIDEITQYCTAADGEQCRAGARFGWRYTYFANGMSQCTEHYTSSGLEEYSCVRSDGKLDKSRQLLNGNQVIDRDYRNGIVSRETVSQAQESKTVNGKQVPDLSRLKKEGISSQFYPDGKPHWQILYRAGNQVCGKEFDQQGQQTAATASCQFPLMLR
ncbi:hypothetical protein [Shewanella sp.]|uniref:toxin-antitoxin system YwqK family antitoxin n=1 Tax=Shewanella sp. TaxID=50422 RepID=UPI003A974ADF